MADLKITMNLRSNFDFIEKMSKRFFEKGSKRVEKGRKRVKKGQKRVEKGYHKIQLYVILRLNEERVDEQLAPKSFDGCAFPYFWKALLTLFYNF